MATQDRFLAEARRLQQSGLAPARTALALMKLWLGEHPAGPQLAHHVVLGGVQLIFPTGGRLICEGEAWRAVAAGVTQDSSALEGAAAVGGRQRSWPDGQSDLNGARAARRAA
jgi:hypothetical protein